MSDELLGSGPARMNAPDALKAEAKRLRHKADMLDKLAYDVEACDGNVLSDDGDAMLWALLMNQRK